MAVKSLIETIEVGSGGASSIEFAAIPQEAGSDLLLSLSSRSDSTSSLGLIKINGVASGGSSGYTAKFLAGSGSSAFSGGDSFYARAWFANRSSSTASTFGNSNIYFSNYASTGAKTWSSDSVEENNAASAYAAIIAGSFSATSAITSLSVLHETGNFVQYTTASLFKIKYD